VPGQDLINRGALAGESDIRPDLVGMGEDVDPGDLDPTGIRLEQGGENANRRGLAGAVGSKQPQDRAALDLEIDPVEGAGRSERFFESLDDDGGLAAAILSYTHCEPLPVYVRLIQ